MTAALVAERAGMSRAKLSKIETDKVRPSAATIRDLGSTLQLSTSSIDSLVELARRTGSSASPLPGLNLVQRQYMAYESQATNQRMLISGIPAILQTHAYVRLQRSRVPLSTRDVIDLDAFVRDRMLRRATLYDRGKSFEFFIGMDAVTNPGLDADDWLLQISLMQEASKLPNVSLRLSEVGGGWAFVVFDHKTVSTDTLTGALFYDEPDEVADYIDILGTIETTAWSASRTRELLATCLDDARAADLRKKAKGGASDIELAGPHARNKA